MSLLRRRFLPYIRPYRGLVALSLLAAFAGLAATTQIPQVLKVAIDGPVTHKDIGRLPLYAGLIVLLGGVEFLLSFGRRQFVNVAGFRMERDIRNDLYAHLQALHVGFHDQWQSGQLLSRAIGDINTIRRFVAFGLVALVQLAVTFHVALFFMIRLDAPLAAITAVAAVPVILLSRHFHALYRRIARRAQDQMGDVATAVEEAATGVRIVKAFGRGPLLIERFDREAGELLETNLAAVRLRSGTWTLMSGIPNFNLAIVILAGGAAAISGRLSVGGLLAFVTYVQMLAWPLDGLGWILSMYEEATSAAERLEEVLSVEPDIADRAITSDQRHDGKAALRFDRVSFRYPGSDRWVLRDLDLDVEPGETLALVGRTGSGKTTLANLVPRLYDATEGRVTIDGVDVRDMSLAELRGSIGVAFEDPILFSASVRENLLMGRPEADEEDLERALEIAQARFAYDLPWGLDTRIGEQGYSLSGGQRQRLALARAVLGNPRLLVLDDPLSAVDVHTEALIENALRDVLHGATAVLVAHRPSTVALADRVALLDGGRVAAVGAHHDLLHKSELYRELLSNMSEELTEEVTA
ncbi:MAG TPA: ABC transporter ATP-binding protein [Candidatus Dormibacteraeota bacterium]